MIILLMNERILILILIVFDAIFTNSSLDVSAVFYFQKQYSDSTMIATYYFSK